MRTFVILTILSITISVEAPCQTLHNTIKTTINEHFSYVTSDSTNIVASFYSGRQNDQLIIIPYTQYPKAEKIDNQSFSWDITDSLFFSIRVDQDHHGVLYPQLVRYNLNLLGEVNNNKEKNDKYIFPKTITNSLPLGLYLADMIASKDRIVGPIYFDVLVNQDSLLNLIYVDDYPKLEVWKYLRTQPNPDRPLTPRDSIAWKQELEANPSGWKRVSNYNVTLTGPFKSFYHKGVCHIITHDMKVYRLGAKALEPVEIRIKDPSKNCLLIDKHNQQVYLTRPPEAFGKGERKGAIEAMMRDRELLFDDK